MGQGPAGPAIDNTAFKKAWNSRSVLLVGIGDSITAGFGAEPGRSYFDRLVRNPFSDSGNLPGIDLASVHPDFKSTNLSVSGSTSPQHLRIQIPKLVRQPTNVMGIVVITTGGNDLIHNYGKTPPSEGAMFGATFEQAQLWTTNFADRLETMIEKILAAFPGGCEIFLANIYDPTDGIGDIHKAGLPAWPDGLKIHAEYNRVIAGAARRHEQVHLVDIYSPFLGHGIHCRQFWRQHYDRADPHYWFHANLEDPNDRGYDALRRLFLNKMIETLVTKTSAKMSEGKQVRVP
jgi:lysophospholipase L1-like esterase